jgi:hypothetical protein
MSSLVTSVLTSPYLLYSTSISSFILARLIIFRVKKNGPISYAGAVIKYNSILYSILSLLLCIGITHSFWIDLSHATPSLEGIICLPSQADYDLMLRYLYHASKIYEYVDIFNVLAVGGVVNAHFGFHHFTVRPLPFPAPFQN